MVGLKRSLHFISRRTDGFRITRTQRAIARSCFDKWVVKDIAEYLHCMPQDVHAAARNDTGDDLSEDPMYLNGRKGDIINLDLSDDEEQVQQLLGAEQADSGSDGPSRLKSTRSERGGMH